MNLRDLAGVCGLYCGACSMYRSRVDGNTRRLDKIIQSRQMKPEDAVCQGCGAEVRSLYCRNCQLRQCAVDKGFTTCAQCPEAPCPKLTAFNNDGIEHHNGVLDSIRRQQEIGLDAWLADQQSFWRCPNCGAPTDWYTSWCFRCSAEVPRRLR